MTSSQDSELARSIQRVSDRLCKPLVVGMTLRGGCENDSSSWKGPPMPNLPRVMLRAPLRVVAWMLLLLVGLAASDGRPMVRARIRRHRRSSARLRKLGKGAEDWSRGMPSWVGDRLWLLISFLHAPPELRRDASSVWVILRGFVRDCANCKRLKDQRRASNSRKPRLVGRQPIWFSLAFQLQQRRAANCLSTPGTEPTFPRN